VHTIREIFDWYSDYEVVFSVTKVNIMLIIIFICSPMLFYNHKLLPYGDYLPMLHKILISLFLLSASSCTQAQKANPLLSRKTPGAPLFKPNASSFKNFLGVNAFEWDFSDQDASVISKSKMEVMHSFAQFRHYIDWEKIESKQGQYTFSPTHSGGWDYDMIYKRCLADGIEVLACLKNGPPWLIDTYPPDKRNGDNVPAPYGLNRSRPSTYTLQAKAGFQYAARYGHNKTIPSQLVTVNNNPRWTNDPINVKKIGLGLINYIECDNERDKDWRGPLAHQNAEEYAANMSAFYDGHKGTLGKNVGVKTADPNMKVVMGGLSVSGPEYVIKMIAWCKKYRGYKPDGSINLCFDVINYHLYNNDWVEGKGSTRGKAPELSAAAAVADKFVAMARRYANNTPVWITEAGYDINPKSPQRAIAIGKKSALITQADWNLRSAFLYVRHGLQRSFFYMLDDVDPKSTIQYSSSGFAEDNKRRPVADYFYQTKHLLSDFTFQRCLKSDPIIDVYGSGKRKIYVLYIPDEKGRTKAIKLDLGTATSAKLYTLKPGATEMTVKTVATINGKLPITVTETPVFVEKI
jgi:hypothetical protein